MEERNKAPYECRKFPQHNLNNFYLSVVAILRIICFHFDDIFCRRFLLNHLVDISGRPNGADQHWARFRTNPPPLTPPPPPQ